MGWKDMRLGSVARARWFRYVDFVVLIAVAWAVCLWGHTWLDRIAVGLLRLAQSWRGGDAGLLAIRLIATVGSVYAICSLMARVRAFPVGLGAWLSSLRYPPVWLAGVLGTIAYLRYAPSPIPARGALDLQTFLYAAMITLVGVGLHVGLTQLGRWSVANRNKASAHTTAPAPDGLKLNPADQGFIDWCLDDRPVEDPKDDRYNVLPIARRILRILAEDRPRTVGLLGPFGSGKSTILRFVEKMSECEGQDPQPPAHRRTIFCRVDAWGVGEDSAARYILERAIASLSAHVDCAAVAGVPRQYRAMLHASGSAWGRLTGVFLDSSDGPCETLERIEYLLRCADRRLILFIEDVERNPDLPRFASEIAPLLDRLKGLQRVSFVFALEPKQDLTTGLERLLDHIEVLPAVRKESVDIVNRMREVLASAFTYIDPIEESKRNSRWKETVQREIAEMSRDEHLGPVELIARVVPTPRLTKKAMSRVWTAWQSLHGEVVLDELIVLNALRTGAWEAYTFLLERMERLRELNGTSNSDEVEKEARVKVLQDEFLARTKDVEWNRDAAWRLVEFLFPDLHTSSPRGDWYLQGIASRGSTDYWARAHAEEIQNGELRDQEVLKSLKAYEQPDEANAARRLAFVADFCINPDLADRVEQLVAILTGEQVRAFAGEVIGHMLTCPATRKTGCDTGVFAALREALLRRTFRSHQRWLTHQIRHALCYDLGVGIDIYYQLRLSDSLHTGNWPHSPLLLTALRKMAKARYCSPQSAGGDGVMQFVQALRSARPFALHDLLYAFRLEGVAEAGEIAWLRPLLLQALRTAPSIIVPQLVEVLFNKSRFKSHDGAGNPSPRWDPEASGEYGETLFGDELPSVMQAVADAEVSGLDEEQASRVRQAQDYAREWLAGRQGQVQQGHVGVSEAEDCDTDGQHPGEADGAPVRDES